MMACKDFVERLDLYLDHRLAGAERSRVARHLHECEACCSLAGKHQERQVVLRTVLTDVVEAVDLSQLWGQVHRAIETDVPADETPGWRMAASRARRRLAQWTMPVPVSFTPLRLTVWAAAAAAVVMLVVFRLGGSDGSSVQVAARTFSAPISHSHTRTRNVRIDSLEASAGHTVATWTQPHTGARIIWVADAGAIPGR